MNLFFVICGYASILFALITQIPQIFTMIKYKSSKNISYLYIFLIITDCILYIIYGSGFLIENNYDGIPIILVGVIPLIITFIIFSIKNYYNIIKVYKKIKDKKIKKTKQPEQPEQPEQPSLEP